MRVCGVCKKAYRQNDPGGTCTVPPDNGQHVSPGHYAACSECCRLYDPAGPFARYCQEIQVGWNAAPESKPHQPDEHGVYAKIPPGTCGMCRMSAREDDCMEAVRVYREDMSAEEAERLIPAHEQQACYAACGECRARWAPLILARLKRQGILPEALRVEQMGVTMFA